VVLGVEDERDGVPDGSVDTRGVVSKARGADFDLDGCGRDGGGDGGEDNSCEGEMHFFLMILKALMLIIYGGFYENCWEWVRKEK
jgi:hypothetical protein